LFWTERVAVGLSAVFLHCVQAASRTPTVGPLYGARRQGTGIDDALADVGAVLPDSSADDAFRESLRRLVPGER
jgi:hypothetical protein